MEERQAAREERQAHLTALQQQLAANFGPNNNNDNNEGGNQRSTLSDFQKTNPPTFSKELIHWKLMIGSAPLRMT